MARGWDGGCFGSNWTVDDQAESGQEETDALDPDSTSLVK